MKLKANTKNWFDPVCEAIKGSRITRLQGNPKAPIVLLAPIPTETELKQNLVWCDQTAELFFEYLCSTIPVDPNQDFIFVPPCFNGEVKLKTASVYVTQLTVSLAAKQPHIRGFLCIGSPTFTAVFGHGKKPNMDMLTKGPIRVAETGFKPLVVVPELIPLTYKLPTEVKLGRREFGERQRAFDQLMRHLPNVAKNIHNLCAGK